MREKFLELFAQAYPKDIHIIQLDNGGCHQALDLSLPENVILLFQPPHCPEANPIERLWLEIKKALKLNRTYANVLLDWRNELHQTGLLPVLAEQSH